MGRGGGGGWGGGGGGGINSLYSLLLVYARGVCLGWGFEAWRVSVTLQYLTFQFWDTVMGMEVLILMFVKADLEELAGLFCVLQLCYVDNNPYSQHDVTAYNL